MPGGAQSLALFLLCLASFMAVVDDTIVTIALPVVLRGGATPQKSPARAG